MHTSRPSRLAFLAVATLIMTVSAGTSCDPTSVTPVVSNVGSVAILVVDDFDAEQSRLEVRKVLRPLGRRRDDLRRQVRAEDVEVVGCFEQAVGDNHAERRLH